MLFVYETCEPSGRDNLGVTERRCYKLLPIYLITGTFSAPVPPSPLPSSPPSPQLAQTPSPPPSPQPAQTHITTAATSPSNQTTTPAHLPQEQHHTTSTSTAISQTTTTTDAATSSNYTITTTTPTPAPPQLSPSPASPSPAEPPPPPHYKPTLHYTELTRAVKTYIPSTMIEGMTRVLTGKPRQGTNSEWDRPRTAWSTPGQ